MCYMWCKVFILVAASSFGQVDCSFDLFVDAKDFQKLLGVESELWYVRDGEVKENALGYVVLVPANVNTLTFYWRARHNIMLPYKLETSVGNAEAAEASLNISHTGSVPTSLQSFSLNINCTGKLTTQVDVTLTLELPLHASLQHLTNITIHRRKICFRGAGSHNSESSVVVSVVSMRGASTVLYATVGCLALFLVVVSGLAAYNHRRHVANKAGRRRVNGCDGGSMQLATSPCLPNNSTSAVAHSQHLPAYHGQTPHQQLGPGYISLHAPSLLRGGGGSQTGGSSHGGSHRTGPAAASSQRTLATSAGPQHTTMAGQQGVPYGGFVLSAGGSCVDGSVTGLDKQPFTDSRQGDTSAKLRSVLVTSASDGGSSNTAASGGCTVKLLDRLLEGTFGRLHRGLYYPATASGGGGQEQHDQEPVHVTVKTIADHSSSQREMFLREAVMLVGVQHSNVHRVLAVTLPANGPPLVLYRPTQHGNMKRFLQTCGPLVTREVVTMGLQVLQALSFLHQERLLHCDVATRNCVVDTSLHVKLGDCSLSRDLFPGDYHCLGDNNNRPVKWLALEALLHNSFSPHSDVWSWGVLLWEVMTLGQQPYAEIDPFEMEDTLRQGVRLAQPINCPDEMFQAMTYCWTNSPLERPTVAELMEYLSGFLLHLDRFV